MRYIFSTRIGQASEEMEIAMLKVGVLGSGFMGSTHARAFAKQPGVQVVGVASRTLAKAETLAREFGDCVASTDFIALVNDPAVDVVSNTLPTPFHEEYTLASLRAGKPVLLEKPMALTLETCDAIIDTARQTGVILMLAHVIRFWPEYLALHSLISSGELGSPLAATARRLSARPQWGDWYNNADWTGGAVLDLHIHDLDALNWFFGTPLTIYSRGQRGPHGAWDYALTVVDYGDVKASAEGTLMMPDGYPFTMSFSVLFEWGSAEFSFRAGGASVGSGASEGTSLTVYQTGQQPRSLVSVSGDAFEAEVGYFVECVRTGKTPERGTPKQGRLAVQTCLAARHAMETNQVVVL